MQRNTCIVCTTTPRSQDHYFSQLYMQVDPKTGEKIFDVLQTSNPCEECQKKDDFWKCNHNFIEDAPWKDKRKINKYSLFYEEQGMSHIHKREQFGMESDNMLRAFSSQDVLDLKNRDLVEVNIKPKVIYLSADPSGGGNSGYAFSAAIRQNDRFVVSIFIIIIIIY